MKKITKNLIITAGTVFGANLILKRIKSKKRNDLNNKNINEEDIFVDEPINYEVGFAENQKNTENDIMRINDDLDRKYFEIPIQKVKTPQTENINPNKKAM